MLVLHVLSVTQAFWHFWPGAGIFLENEDWGCKKSNGGVEHRGPKGRGQALQARESRRRSCWGGRGCPTGRGIWGGGSAPSPENLLTLDLQMVTFGAFWWVFFYVIQLPVLHAKTGLLGFQNLPLQFTVVFQADDNDWWSHKSSQPGVVDLLLPVVPSSCELCMSVVEGSTDTPIAFIIILGMERHICAVVFVVNYCTNSPDLTKLRC